jgi:hypothetical protein
MVARRFLSLPPREAARSACLLALAGLVAVSGCGGKSTSGAGKEHETAGAGGDAARGGETGIGGSNLAGGNAPTGGDSSVGGASIAGGGTGGTTAGSAGLGQSGSETTSMHSSDVCAMVEARAYRRVLDLVFVVDRSAGMQAGWADASAALIAFFRDPSVRDTAISLRFFPDDRPVAGCDSMSCNEEACSTPLVPLAELDPAANDPQEAMLVAAVESTETTGESGPQLTAYQGAVAVARSAISDQHRVAIVLVTAGLSSGCGRSLQELVASTYAEDEIPTFVVAPPTSPELTALDSLAASGGSAKALRFGAPDESNPLFSLIPIRGDTYSCDIPVSQDPGIPPLDFYQAWMTVALDDDPPFEVPRVMTAADCRSDVGFYYDDNFQVELVEFCPALCEELSQNRDAVVTVTFPCLERLE